MPIIQSRYGNIPTIKSWSFEMVVTPDGVELCEVCAEGEGFDIMDEEVSPIFADTEMDRESVCDSCGYVSELHTILDDYQLERLTA